MLFFSSKKMINLSSMNEGKLYPLSVQQMDSIIKDKEFKALKVEKTTHVKKLPTSFDLIHIIVQSSDRNYITLEKSIWVKKTMRALQNCLIKARTVKSISSFFFQYNIAIFNCFSSISNESKVWVFCLHW